jgi:hypothetical protein
MLMARRLVGYRTLGARLASTSPLWSTIPPPVDFPPVLERLTDREAHGTVPVRTSCSAGFQDGSLLRCGMLDTSNLQGALDPAFLSSMLNFVITDRMYLPDGHPDLGGSAFGEYGAAHVSERLKLMRPLRVSEPLHIKMVDETPTPHPKGTLLTYTVDVLDDDGAVVLQISREGLFLNAAAPQSSSSSSKKKKKKEEASRPPADPREGRSLVSTTVFTPDMVAGCAPEPLSSPRSLSRISHVHVHVMRSRLNLATSRLLWSWCSPPTEPSTCRYPPQTATT